MKVIHSDGPDWCDQNDYNGYIIYTQWSGALFLSNRMLLKMKALGEDLSYTRAGNLKSYLRERRK